MKKNDILLLLGVIVGIPVLYKCVMWLILDYGLNPYYITVIITYIVIVYPQYTALHALKLMNAINEDEELNGVRADKINLIPFLNDFTLSSYVGTDNAFKLINSVLMKLSIPILLFSLLYNNIVVVFWDLGVNFTLFMMYAMLVSIAVYIVTKTIMIMYLINMFKGIGVALTGIAHPIGFMVITWSVKHYFNSLETVRHEETMGVSYE